MENNNVINDSEPTGESLTLQGFLKACAAKWQWFAISIAFFTCVGVLYVIRQQPEYLRKMSVLIKDQDGKGGGIGNIANAFSSMGLVSTNTNVYNELISLMSPAVMMEVVERLDLEMNYFLKGLPHGTTLYGTNLPFVVKFEDMDPEHSGVFRADVNPDGTMRLYKFQKVVNGEKTKYDGEVRVPQRFCTVKTPLGRVTFSPNPRYTGEPYDEQQTIVVARAGFLATVEGYSNKLKGDLADRDAEVIDLSLKDVSKERADDILSTVLDVYTSKWMYDKNQIAAATSDFIDDRLATIVSDLGDVDAKIMDYKKKNLIPDLEEAGRLTLRSSYDIDQEVLQASSELSMAKYVEDYVKNPANANRVIPMNTGGLVGQLEAQIANYNNLLLSRNSIEESTSASNPIVKDYDAQLKGMHESIEKGLSTQVVTLSTTLRNLEKAKGQFTGQLSQGPEMANYLLSVERQQKVKEELYLYLLQKREENELTRKFTADNTRVITPPMGSIKPVSPKKALTVVIAFLIGLVLPGAAVYMRESSNTKVRSRKDLERMTTPFVGEIPFVGKKRGKWLSKLLSKKNSQKLETMEISVRSGSRDLINESFRIVRGNIDFMTRRDNAKVFMTTSFNAGSGKSFVTYNLAASFAIKGKKVLLIDCDLRHGSTSQFVGMPTHGITSYLTGKTSDWEKLVVPVSDQPGMYVLPIGHRPPNPAELLETEEMTQLVEEARKEYDIIFIDCPPVDVVVDTQIVSPLVDRTIFVVRAGLLEKASVPEIDKFYQTERFKNISILLNGTEQHFSRYGGEGKGYYGSQYIVEDK